MDDNNLPSADSIDTTTRPPPQTPTDATPATLPATITHAQLTLRTAISSTPHPPTLATLTTVSRALHGSLRSISQALLSDTCPPCSGSLVLHAVTEMLERVVQMHCISALAEQQQRSQFSPARPAASSPTSESATRLLRYALVAADSLTFEACMLHFSSGGRRAALVSASASTSAATSTSASATTTASTSGTADSRDQINDLQSWRTRFERLRKEVGSQDEVFGLYVFADTLVWVEDTVFGALRWV